MFFDDEGHRTTTSKEQQDCEIKCNAFFVNVQEYSRSTREEMKKSGLLGEKDEIRLLREKHVAYLKKNLGQLSSSFACLDASRPWMIYWILQALFLLNEEPVERYPDVVSTLRSMQNDSGGFGGGPQQLSHFAPTYAAVLSLCIIGTDEALSIIDRTAMYKFMLDMKDPVTKGIRMHRDGEIDTRSIYTCLVVARVLNILTPELCDGVAEYLLSCQTYEGGFGGEPFNEAHGGYNFCAFAALLILGRARECDVSAQKRWLLKMQTQFEGGFRGRTNKLVDACYSFWQGGAFAVLRLVELGLSDIGDCLEIKESEKSALFDADMNNEALQKYIIHCAQQPEGGLRDKPGKGRDFYHSCYALSGLSIAQHYHQGDKLCYGDKSNMLNRTSAVYNIGVNRLKHSLNYFSAMPNKHDDIIECEGTKTKH